ncbi:hypothetical protein BDV97DRAFT_376656 [Delphinella strobiligena]|nr:hypothetical protein BDV97DRAFT_376656 [Delphinella strobiligena]
MSRRLAQLSEEGLEAGGRRAAKAVEEAGFDEELKRKLEERIASASFRNDNIRAFAEAELPTSAGRQTRDLATAAPWSGTESVEDASLRMLNDSIKPIKVSRKAPPIRGPPARVETGRSRTKPSSGARLANARDKTSVYAQLKEMPENEREQFRKEMKERFTANARSVPVSITGLESLASQRIEDAIARGQFKNLPRGKVIERDYNASSPFIDTTEYLLNRMIQRQEIVPPWIEKQQELVSTTARFRGRLRSDWRRHVARSIASRGGSLESQMALAEEHALAEAIHNPSPKKVEKLNTVDEGGHLSQITLTGEVQPTDVTPGTHDPQVLKVTEETIDLAGEVVTSEGEAKLTVESSTPTAPAIKSNTRVPSVPPFRDSQWLQTERSYQKVAVENLNTLTRSYNLMCPQLAQRPYFDLQRELNACFAEVAPLVAQEIHDRAFAPKVKVETFGTKPPSVLEKFAGGHAKVYDERKPQYGFKELLKDWFGRNKSTN